MKIHIKQLPYSLPDFHVKLANYLLARNAHRLTVGTAAPFPDHELLRVIAERIESNEAIEIYDDPPLVAAEPLPLPEAVIAQDTAEKEALAKPRPFRLLDLIA